MFSRLFLCIALCLVSASVAQADYITSTVTLNQSNALKDGVNYGSVYIEAYNGVGTGGGGLKAGEVRLTYTAASAPYKSTDPWFGILSVGFNTDLSLKSSQIKAPGGWLTVSNTAMDGFGTFNKVSGSLLSNNPVSILITGLGANATPDHFLFGSTSKSKDGPSQGSVDFAMLVSGINVPDNILLDAHYVGGSAEEPPPPGGSGEEVQETPEPSTFILGGICLGCATIVRASKRRKETN